MTFTGHSIAVVAPKSPHRGKAKIYIDGKYVVTVNMTSSTSKSRLVAFSQWFPAGGTHTIQFIATGAGAYPRVWLDAFVVGR
jgi:hypothetical protein